MQLLTLAGTLFLIIYSVAAQGTENVGPCEKERKEVGAPMPGKYIPSCTKYGYYNAVQCHGSIGKCWCVNPETGKEIKGTSTFRTAPPQCTMCNVKLAEALRPKGFVGNYVPICDEDGLFASTQRYGSTGQSWCVNRYTGEEIAGTRVGPGEQRTKECNAAALLIGLNMQSPLLEQGPCYAKIIDARGRDSALGFYTPSCTKNGYFKTEQFHGSTGYTWCVNPATGAEIKDTRRSPSETRAECGACFKAIEERLSRKFLLGAELSQCNEENGDYIPEQHMEGYSYCVNPKTGAVEGKKHPPGDNTPLNCVNH